MQMQVLYSLAGNCWCLLSIDSELRTAWAVTGNTPYEPVAADYSISEGRPQAKGEMGKRRFSVSRTGFVLRSSMFLYPNSSTHTVFPSTSLQAWRSRSGLAWVLHLTRVRQRFSISMPVMPVGWMELPVLQ